MMRVLADVARHQALVWSRRLAGRNADPAPLGSTTLDADDVAIARAWLSRDDSTLGGGDPTARFESAFARWNGSRTAVAFMSGRESLSAIIEALGLEPGDEVIVPGYTCVVVANAFAFQGVTPVFADIEADTYGLDVTQLGRHVTARTKAIVIQHLYGLVCRDYRALLAFAAARGLRVIEDCAQATGAEAGGVRVGNRADAAFYSLEQSKLLTSFQGGVAIANDPEIAARLSEIRDRAPLPSPARTRRVLHNIVLNYRAYKDPQRWWRRDADRLMGAHRIETTTAQEVSGRQPEDYGARMPAPLAAVAENQLRKLDFYNARRREHAARYDRWCDEHGFARARVVPDTTPVFLRYPVMATAALKSDRRWARRELDVELGVWFTSHLHPSERAVAGCPNAADAVARCINFPTLFGDRAPVDRNG